MRSGIARRAWQAISKFFFCLRVAGDLRTFLRLLVQSKRLNRYQKEETKEQYDEGDPALVYHIRYLSSLRTIWLRTDAGDIRIFYEIFWEKVYWLPTALVAGPLVIVDAGSHVGMAALYFSIVYPRARIYCIEPDGPNFKLLQENLAPLVGEGRGVLVEAALYDREGMIGLAVERWAYNSRIDEHAGPADGGRAGIKTITMDGLSDRFQLEKIDLLKIDIEGAEDKIFGVGTGEDSRTGENAGTGRNAGTDWLRKVNAILVEVHSLASIGPIRTKLKENGFHWAPWDRSIAGGSLFLASKAEIPRLADR